MREIRFRVWDDIIEKMYCPGDAKYCVTMLGRVCDDETDDGGKLENRDYRSTAMLSTGLRDKNGTEIYEGDILCVPDYTPRDDGNYDDEVVEVYFDDGRLIWAFRYGSYGFDYLTEAEGATIIGNIHENPELLK